jgi:glycine cleavage system H protein
MTRYTKDHEWIRLEDAVAVMGITDHAQSQLGDVVYVELPTIGTRVKAGDQFAVVESVKAASDIYAPASGTVTAINEGLVDEPSLVNSGAEAEGWFVKLTLDRPSELDQLMDKAAYDAMVAGGN